MKELFDLGTGETEKQNIRGYLVENHNWDKIAQKTFEVLYSS